MLMITKSDAADLTRTLKLEGKLMGPWIRELELACAASQAPADRVRLDLGALTYVDAAGARFLESLIRDGARVIACTEFVAEMIRLERH